jgi:hypothetical protein
MISVSIATTAVAAASPITNVTTPSTMAFASKNRLRRGLATKVMRIMPRRYSAVMNIVPTTMTSTPADAELRQRL